MYQCLYILVYDDVGIRNGNVLALSLLVCCKKGACASPVLLESGLVASKVCSYMNPLYDLTSPILV